MYCKICNLDKPINDFLNGRHGATVKTCRDCRSIRDRNKRASNLLEHRKKDKINYQKRKAHRVQYAREYRAKYPERTRATNWKAKYGITPEDFYLKLSLQKNKCAICQRDMNEYGKIFCVDHNHKTGEIRGLLCDPCNYGIGFYEKHKDKYVIYLSKFKT